MSQVSKDKLCYYCLGCVKEEEKKFKAVNRCKNFVPGRENWQEKIREELKKSEQIQ